MLNAKYAFISACLKGEEPRAVTAEHIDRMVTAPGFQQALAVIRETDIGSYLEELPVKTFDDLDEALWRYLGRCIAYVESFKFLPKDVLKLSRTYVVKYDVANIKAALQSIITGKKTRMIPVGTIHNHGLLDELAKAESVYDIAQILVRCELGDYVPAVEECRVDKGVRSRLAAEVKLDGEYYKHMLNLARKLKDGFVLAKAFGLVIDLVNLQIALRAVIEHIGPEATDFVIAGGYRITDKTIGELLALKIGDIPEKLEDSQYREIANEVSANYDKTGSLTTVDEVIDKHKFRMLKEILSPRVLSPLVMAW